jgi:hypothetical protein
MSVTLTTPITGSAQNGLTAPSATIVADRAPDAANGYQVAVTAMTGHASIRVSSTSDPFTHTYTRPKVVQTLIGLAVTVAGLYGKVGENVHRFLTRKGVNIAANNLPRLMTIETIVRVPAGADSYDPVNIRAGLSVHIGALTQASSGWGDTLVTNIL